METGVNDINAPSSAAKLASFKGRYVPRPSAHPSLRDARDVPPAVLFGVPSRIRLFVFRSRRVFSLSFFFFRRARTFFFASRILARRTTNDD
jgi:hypothetical protein